MEGKRRKRGTGERNCKGKEEKGKWRGKKEGKEEKKGKR